MTASAGATCSLTGAAVLMVTPNAGGTSSFAGAAVSQVTDTHNSRLPQSAGRVRATAKTTLSAFSYSTRKKYGLRSYLLAAPSAFRKRTQRRKAMRLERHGTKVGSANSSSENNLRLTYTASPMGGVYGVCGGAVKGEGKGSGGGVRGSDDT